MPKLITMREMLAGAPTGVPGLYGIGHYEPVGVAEATYSPYDQPGRSARLWQHSAVGADQSPGQPNSPPILQPGMAQVVAKAMCETAKGTWDPVANVCVTAAGPIPTADMPKLFCQGQGGTWDPVANQCAKIAPTPPPKKPWMSPTTTALVVLGIVGLGAIWAFGGGKKKSARANPSQRRRRARQYRVIWVRDDKGTRGVLAPGPFTHQEAVTVLRKQRPQPWRRDMLEEIR